MIKLMAELSMLSVAMALSSSPLSSASFISGCCCGHVDTGGGAGAGVVVVVVGVVVTNAIVIVEVPVPGLGPW